MEEMMTYSDIASLGGKYKSTTPSNTSECPTKSEVESTFTNVTVGGVQSNELVIVEELDVRKYRQLLVTFHNDSNGDIDAHFTFWIHYCSISGNGLDGDSYLEFDHNGQQYYVDIPDDPPTASRLLTFIIAPDFTSNEITNLSNQKQKVYIRYKLITYKPSNQVDENTGTLLDGVRVKTNERYKLSEWGDNHKYLPQELQILDIYLTATPYQ